MAKLLLILLLGRMRSPTAGSTPIRTAAADRSPAVPARDFPLSTSPLIPLRPADDRARHIPVIAFFVGVARHRPVLGHGRGDEGAGAGDRHLSPRCSGATSSASACPASSICRRAAPGRRARRCASTSRAACCRRRWASCSSGASARVPLAQAIALAFIAPLIALYLAAVLLKETVGQRTVGGVAGRLRRGARDLRRPGAGRPRPGGADRQPRDPRLGGAATRSTSS